MAHSCLSAQWLAVFPVFGINHFLEPWHEHGIEMLGYLDEQISPAKRAV
jgi:hypothetical protein